MLLLFPDHPERFTLATFARLPLEWPLIVLAVTWLSGGPNRLVRAAVVLLLMATVLLRVADIGSYTAFDRRFSPLVEWHLLGDGWTLASASIGAREASVAVILALLLLIGLALLVYRGLGAAGRLRGGPRRGLTGLSLLMLAVGGAALASGARSPFPAQADLIPELVDRSKAMNRSIADQNAFLTELASDPIDPAAPPRFEALAGRDVIVLFIESYGRSFIDDEDLGQVADQRLKAVQREVSLAGVGVRSAWLESPIRGGRSWLAHATFASGLSISNQARFDRLIASDRESVYRLFGAAGWHTAGLNPAIVQAWPEGAWYGYAEDHDVHSLGYRGENFGWVTMPDQYTLSRFEHAIREPAPRPVAAKIALISSHAPWTPLARLIPWEDVGDGSVFDGSHRFGGKPNWSDRQLVRTLYAQSLDYTLETIGQYVARHADDALIIVLGDHQPASIIAGWGRTADVPIHVFSRDERLLDRLPDTWWTPGMVPDADTPGRPMASMRAFLAEAFDAPLSSPAELPPR